MRLPKKLYVTLAGEAQDKYLLAYEKPEEMAEVAALVDVGIYELKCKAQISTSVEVQELERPVYKSTVIKKK